MPNVNIPETEKIKLVRTHQEKRRRQPVKKRWTWSYLPGEERRGGLDGDGLTTPEGYENMNWQLTWLKTYIRSLLEKLLGGLAHKDVEMVSKCENSVVAMFHVHIRKMGLCMFIALSVAILYSHFSTCIACYLKLVLSSPTCLMLGAPSPFEVNFAPT